MNRLGPHRRAVAVVVAVAFVVTGCTSGGDADPQHTASTVAGHVLSSSATVAALAAAGVGTVADVSSTAPQVPVTGPRVMTLTAWQTGNLVSEAAAHGGVVGADLDQAIPTPGAPALSQMVSAWALAGTDRAATTAATILGSQDWRRTDTIIFPTEVLTLFAADALQHVEGPAATATTGAATTGAATAQPAAFVAAPDLSAPCTAISSFFGGILNAVFGALKLNPEAVSEWVSGKLGGGVLGAIGGGFAGWAASWWNKLVDTAQSAVQTILTSLTQPVLDVLRLVIGAVATLTMVASYIKAWHAKVTADPVLNRYAVGAEAARTGTFTVSIDKGAEIADWPPALVDCATVLKITLPTLSRPGLPVSWKLLPTRPGLATLDGSGPPYSTVLDDKLASSVGYTTGREAKAEGTITTGTAVATAQVRRSEVDDLRKLVAGFVEDKVPGLIKPVVDPILDAYLEQATKYLDNFINVEGSGTLVVSYHVKTPPTPTPTPTCTTTGKTIPAGTFAGPIKATITEAMHLDLPGATIPNAGGGKDEFTGQVTIRSDGSKVTGSIAFAGSGKSHVGLPGATNVHSNSTGSFKGKISGPASAPVVAGTMHGAWASLDAPVINGHGTSNSHARLGLHVTQVTCTAVTGDVVALFREIAAPVRQYLSIGGSGDWTATRK